MGSRHEGDLAVTGTLNAGTFNLSAGCVTDSNVSASAAISAEKLEQQHKWSYSQNGTAASATVGAFIATAAGTVLSIEAASIAACSGAATITIDLKKNGATILTGAIQLDNGNTARILEAGSLTAGATFADGDFFELVIVATAGGGTLGTGLTVSLVWNEAASL